MLYECTTGTCEIKGKMCDYQYYLHRFVVLVVKMLRLYPVRELAHFLTLSLLQVTPDVIHLGARSYVAEAGRDARMAKGLCQGLLHAVCGDE